MELEERALMRSTLPSSSSSLEPKDLTKTLVSRINAMRVGSLWVDGVAEMGDNGKSSREVVSAESCLLLSSPRVHGVLISSVRGGVRFSEEFISSGSDSESDIMTLRFLDELAIATEGETPARKKPQHSKGDYVGA